MVRRPASTQDVLLPSPALQQKQSMVIPAVGDGDRRIGSSQSPSGTLEASLDYRRHCPNKKWVERKGEETEKKERSGPRHQ